MKITSPKQPKVMPPVIIELTGEEAEQLYAYLTASKFLLCPSVPHIATELLRKFEGIRNPWE